MEKIEKQHGYRGILSFYLPLFLNQGVITLTAPFLNYGVSRAVTPEMALAAFGSAFSLTIIFNSMVFTSLKLYNSLLKDRKSFQIILGMYLVLAGIATLVFAVVALTNAGDYIFSILFNLGQETIFHAKEWMLWIIPAPVLLAVRCALQGVTTVYRKTVNTALGTGLRIATALVMVLVMIGLFPHRPGMASGAAFSLSMGLEVAFLLVRTRKMIQFPAPTSIAPYDFDLTISYVIRYSIPLWISSLAWTGSFPMINYFIGQTWNSEAGLAGFSILRSLNVCLNSPLNSLVTVVLILGNNRTIKRLRTMGIALGVGLTLVSAGLCFTSLGHRVLSGVFNLSGDTLEWSGRALIFFLFTPVLFFIRFYVEGILMRRKQPKAIGVAGGIRLTLLFVSGLFILWFLPEINGVNLGMAMMTIAALSDAVVTTFAFYAGQSRGVVFEKK